MKITMLLAGTTIQVEETLDFQHTLTLICPSCNTNQTFQTSANRLVCPACGWKGAFNLPVTPPKKVTKSGKVARRSFNERIRDITIQKTSRGFRISWQTFTWRNLLLIFAAAGWGCLLFLIFDLIKENPTDPNILLFLVLYMLTWAGLGYSALALTINRVVLVFDRKNMSRRHDPLPFWGEFEMPLEFIQLFYAEGLNDKTSSKQTPIKKQEKGERTEMLLHTRAESYRLVAVLLSEREIPLFSHFSRPEIIYFIQEQITAWLNEANTVTQLQHTQKA
jgi:ribosomal protein L37AE/L43A